MNDTEKYMKAENELAALLGIKYPPSWCSNSTANQNLMVEYRIQPQYYNTMFYLIAYQGIHPTTVYIEQHNNDRMLAFRYGVVLAVIQKLKEDSQPSLKEPPCV